MHFNCRNLNATVLLQSLTTSCWLYTWEQTNSSNKFAANLNMKGISFLTPPLDNVLRDIATVTMQWNPEILGKNNTAIIIAYKMLHTFTICKFISSCMHQ